MQCCHLSVDPLRFHSCFSFEHLSPILSQATASKTTFRPQSASQNAHIMSIRNYYFITNGEAEKVWPCVTYSTDSMGLLKSSCIYLTMKNLQIDSLYHHTLLSSSSLRCPVVSSSNCTYRIRLTFVRKPRKYRKKINWNSKIFWVMLIMDLMNTRGLLRSTFLAVKQWVNVKVSCLTSQPFVCNDWHKTKSWFIFLILQYHIAPVSNSWQTLVFKHTVGVLVHWI